MNLLVFLISLPLAVWIIASWFDLLDSPDKSLAMKRIAWRTGLLLFGVYCSGYEARTTVFAAFAVVAVLHLGWFLLSRVLMRAGRINARVVD